MTKRPTAVDDNDAYAVKRGFGGIFIYQKHFLSWAVQVVKTDRVATTRAVLVDVAVQVGSTVLGAAPVHFDLTVHTGPQILHTSAIIYGAIALFDPTGPLGAAVLLNISYGSLQHVAGPPVRVWNN